MLVIYQAVCEDDIDRLSGEESEMICWQEQPPLICDWVRMQGADEWQVIQTAAYRNKSESVCVAMVQKSDIPVPNESEWTVNGLKEGCPDLSFYVYLAPDQTIITHGWSMTGNEPDRQLYRYEPTDSTLMKATPDRWQVDRIDCYTPARKSDYKQIHLAWCVEVREAIAA